MLRLTLEDLVPHQLENHKENRKNCNFDDNIIITLTTQGERQYNGANFSFHIKDFTNYPYVRIFKFGNRMYFLPCVSDAVGGYSLTTNISSCSVYSKVGNQEQYKIIEKFSGTHKAEQEHIGPFTVWFIEI